MKKIYTLLFMLFAGGMVAQAAKGDVCYYSGSLDVEMGGEQILDGQGARISMTEKADGTFTFLLPDFTLLIGDVGDEPFNCGDIQVDGVTRTDADGNGVFEIAGSIDELILAEGAIHAKADITGTETADGKMNLTIAVGWYVGYPDDMETIMPINVAFGGNKLDSRITAYNGLLNVEMGGEMIVGNQGTTVYLQTIGDSEYLFKLPDFTLLIGDVGDEPFNCGDILVDGVTRTDADGNGTFEIEGSTDELILAEGAIHAKVDITGTETSDGKMDLTIAVGWYVGYPGDMETIMPINVTFVGAQEAGVADAVVSGAECYGAAGGVAIRGFAGNAAVYTIDGRLVKTVAVDGDAVIPLQRGLYIVRTDATATKAVVK